MAESARLRLPCTSVTPACPARFGFFFEPDRWEGEPVNRELRKHSELVWADPASLQPGTVDYTAKAIGAIQQGCSFTRNGWLHQPLQPS